MNRILTTFRIYLWTIASIPFVYAIASPRNFSNTIDVQNIDTKFAVLIGQVYPILSLIMFLSTMFLRNIILSRTSLLIILSLLPYYIISFLFQIFSTIPYFSLGLVTPTIMLLPLLIIDIPSKKLITREIITICLFYGYGSIVSSIISFDWTIESNYSYSLISTLPFRLHGITSHANTLSGILLVYFAILIFSDDIKSRKIHPIAMLVILIATQSKTAFVILLLLFMFNLLIKKLKYVNRNLVRNLIYISLSILSIVAVQFSSLIDLENTPDASSLLAREKLWDISVEYWRNNPLFGYGPTFWGSEMASNYYSILGWLVPHAHNQFYQTLGSMGLAGVVCLLSFVGVLLYTSHRILQASVLPRIFLILFLIRGVTEVPLRNVIDSNYFFLFVTLIIFIIHLKEVNIRKNAVLFGDPVPISLNSGVRGI